MPYTIPTKTTRPPDGGRGDLEGSGIRRQRRREPPDDVEDLDPEEDPELERPLDPDDRAPDDREDDPEDERDGARADDEEDLPDDGAPR